MSRRMILILILPMLGLLALMAKIVNERPKPELDPTEQKIRETMAAAEKDPSVRKKMQEYMQKQKETDLEWEHRMMKYKGPVKDTMTDEWYRTRKDGGAGLRDLKPSSTSLGAIADKELQRADR